MTTLSTHILDLTVGRPAADVAVRLYRREDHGETLVAARHTDADGRARLLDAGELALGRWRLSYEIGVYFARAGVEDPTPAFLDTICVDFVVAEEGRAYHVPLLVSPYGYSTYRGS